MQILQVDFYLNGFKWRQMETVAVSYSANTRTHINTQTNTHPHKQMHKDACIMYYIDLIPAPAAEDQRLTEGGAVLAVTEGGAVLHRSVNNRQRSPTFSISS